MKRAFLGFIAAWLASTAMAQTTEPAAGAAPAAAAPAPAVPPTQDAIPAPAPTPVIAWRVERRFRLWDIPAFSDQDRADAEALYQALGGAPSPDDVHDKVVAFVKTHRALQAKGFWNAQTRTFKISFVYPKSYVVRIGLANGADFPGQTCAWSTTVGKLDLATAPCGNSVAITLPASGRGDGAPPATVTVTPINGAAHAETIRVHDRLIVSFGDSFASGEGNPDIPANLSALTGGWGVNGSAAYRQVWVGRDAMNGVKSPSWIDLGCHRSSLNQHMVAALKYAADRPHEAVTFLSYACSGAAIFNGLLTPQREPPGYKDSQSVTKQDVSQVEMAVRDLCPPDANGASTAQEIAARNYKRRLVKNWLWSPDEDTVSAPAFGCAGAGVKRPVDAVLLSDGGNDAGFSSVIMWTLLPKAVPDPGGMVLLQYLRNDESIALSPPSATKIVGQALGANLQTLSARLKEFAPTAPVIVGAYPSPVRVSGDKYCGPPMKTQRDADKNPANARLIAVSAAIPLKFLNLQTWRAVIDQDDEEQVEPVVVESLNNKLKLTSDTNHWVFVKSGADKVGGHGWCAGDAIAETADLPDYNADTATWSPWRPNDWDPYLRRARFFRTPNDAALTQRPEAPRPLGFPGDSLIDDHGRALLASFAGSFHPTFQAHVVMGLDLAYALEDKLPSAP